MNKVVAGPAANPNIMFTIENIIEFQLTKLIYSSFCMASAVKP